MEQKIVLSPAELAQLVGKSKDEDKPHIAAANKEDYVRLAKLKLEKQFAPRIQSVQNRVDKIKKEYADEFPSGKLTTLAVKRVEAEEAESIEKAVGVITALNDAGKRATDALEAFVGKRIPEFLAQLDADPKVSVTSVNSERIAATITIGKYAKYVSVESGASVRDFISERDAKMASVKKAEEDLEILMKCKTKAEQAVLGEVEESLLTHMIGKIAETKEIQEDINARVEAALQDRLLSAGE